MLLLFLVRENSFFIIRSECSELSACAQLSHPDKRRKMVCFLVVLSSLALAVVPQAETVLDQDVAAAR